MDVSKSPVMCWVISPCDCEQNASLSFQHCRPMVVISAYIPMPVTWACAACCTHCACSASVHVVHAVRAVPAGPARHPRGRRWGGGRGYRSSSGHTSWVCISSELD